MWLAQVLPKKWLGVFVGTREGSRSGMEWNGRMNEWEEYLEGKMAVLHSNHWSSACCELSGGYQEGLTAQMQCVQGR